jgi:hypothetical protein
MTSASALRSISYVSIGLALVLAILSLMVHVAPSAPAYLTFLFTGLVGGFAGAALRDLERRLAAVERRL